MAGFSVKIVKDLDRAKLQALADRTRKAGARIVNVGYPDGPKEENGTSVAMIAAVHNFGSPARGIPERPFMTQAVTGAREKFIALNRRNIPLVLQDQMTTDEALGQLGTLAVSLIQQQIKNGDFKELKEETIERKGSSKPLIDDGQMLQSTTYMLGNKK